MSKAKTAKAAMKPIKQAAPSPLEDAATQPICSSAPTKLDQLITILRRPDGATLDEMMAATGWQRHSVRGALAGGVKKRLGAAVTSQKANGVRVYRIANGDQA